MEQDKNNSGLGLAFKLFKNMQQDNLEYTYRGHFSTAITDNILSLAESNLEETKDKLKIRKRVYFIMVEGLQNITRHQEESSEGKEEPGLFVIQRKKNSYYITTGNLIKKDNIYKLKDQLEKINSLDATELKEYYREILNSRSFSNKGGAGLGLIEIARKSGKKLLYDFENLNEKYSFFYLHTEIPFSEKNFNKIENPEVILSNIKSLHKILEKHNILLNFTGIFNQDNLINLLTIIERQMKGTVILKMKVYNIMVEMLQNILKHADNYTFNDVSGHYGIFFISEKDNGFLLTSGNYVLNKRVPELKGKLDEINVLDQKGLNEYYAKTLVDFKEDESKRSGLGILDMRIKSKEPFVYEFYPVDEEYSFFSLQITIQKKLLPVKPLIIEAKKDTPNIIFDAEKSVFSITGKSYPEDAHLFYEPVLKWIEEYGRNPNAFTVFEFKLDYYNTSTTKQFTKILFLLEKFTERSAIKIKWYYKKEDDDALAAGLRFSKLVEIEFNLIELDEYENFRNEDDIEFGEEENFLM